MVTANCSACWAGIPHGHGSRGTLFTFGLVYGATVEEIDVVGSDVASARETARLVAESAYEPGWDLVDLPPGGSGGLVYGTVR